MSRLSALVEIIALKPILRRKDLTLRYGVCPATIDKWVASGTIPAPRYLRRCPFPFWTPSEIEQNERTNPRLIHEARGSWRKSHKKFPHHASKKRTA